VADLATDPFAALIVAIAAVLWVVLAAAAVLCVTAARVLHRRRARDMEALIDATREQLPDHVPAEWVKEHGR
jgi:hypothetical protein